MLVRPKEAPYNEISVIGSPPQIKAQTAPLLLSFPRAMPRPATPKKIDNNDSNTSSFGKFEKLEKLKESIKA